MFFFVSAYPTAIILNRQQIYSHIISLMCSIALVCPVFSNKILKMQYLSPLFGQ